MPENTVRLPFGDDKELTIRLPEQWEVIGVCKPNDVPPCDNAAAEARRAMSNPVGSPTLSELCARARKVAVVVDDNSRATPVRLFFDEVMREIESAGITPEQITVVVALGVHPPMNEKEIADKIGKSGATRFHIINHDFQAADLARLGRTKRGTEVYLNKIVAEADVVVLLGSIEPHVIAGFGGGYKNLFPGCAGKVTIAANHRLNTVLSTVYLVGTAPEENPMRCDLEDCGRLVPGKVFLVNAVFDENLRITRIVAGDPVAAHREGIRASEELHGVRIPRQADVVVMSSHPTNLNLRMGFKAFANTIPALRPGGLMLNYIVAEKGLDDMTMPARKLRVGKHGIKFLAPFLAPFVGRLNFGMKEEDVFFVYFALQAFSRNDIYFYAPSVTPLYTERIPFIEIFNDANAMMEKAAKAMPQKATVLVFPQGGATYPILPPVAGR